MSPLLRHWLYPALVTMGIYGLPSTALAKPPVCTISSPQSGVVSISSGGSLLFQGVVVDGTAPYSVTWTFSGGQPASASETLPSSGSATATHLVTYNTAGSFTATLAATDSDPRNPKSCSATRTVQVTSATNSRPVAQGDEYNTTEATPLVVIAPGVLSNDNDPDGDPITAQWVAGSGPSHGVLLLATDGGFSYTPDAGYTGADSFVYTANDAGGASNQATVTIGVAGANEVSINSTSANGPLAAVAVAEPTAVSGSDYRLLAINDLGMHCGDLDTRLSSILPPFNVVHAQVVARGISGLPRVMGEGEAQIYYSAAANPSDPAIAKATSGQVLSSVVNGEVYKSNFWEVAYQAYDPFYPPGLLSQYYDPNTPAINVDLGLPVPDVERLYLGDGTLHVSQQAMPGFTGPYTSNQPQLVEEHVTDLPFFTSFPFGYVANVNWSEAAGIPVAPFDDAGRENPYPLLHLEAKVAGQAVASLDTVVPISGEADCQACHAAEVDGGNGAAIGDLTTVATSLDDPAHGSVPNAVSVEWSSDLNILRLHDQKHGTSLESTIDPTSGRAANPVICQRCHYSPALDLAQQGPVGPENAGSAANGRDQFKHRTMSNVMHSYHGQFSGLFPAMPPAMDANGSRRSPVTTQQVLEQTCYRCHPGRRTQCMRGAMANGGLVCQDCHGNMSQVGNDFSRNVSPANPGAFELAADFYHNQATPRVPWANEPSCGSCHTGNAIDNLAGDANVLVNPTDSSGVTDGIRLLAAYRTNDAKATPIVPINKQFAESVVATGGSAAGNPKLYRVSSGHGGLMCEACHGSTHAEWPSSNPNANDNLPAKQLQGHSGYIAECQVCHQPTDTSLPLGNNGPHGMHAISDLEFSNPAFVADDRWNLQHKAYRNSGPGCNSCHGADLTGSVLSRTAEERTVRCKDTSGSLPGCAAGQATAVIPKGTAVGCGLCHRQK